MEAKEKKKPRVFDYFVEEDQFAGGNNFCAGCSAELAIRLIPKVMGKDLILVGTPCCAAPVMHGQNLGAWHKLSYYASLMTGVASSATGISRYLRKTGTDHTICCFTGDGGASDVGFQPLSGAAERNEHLIYICYDNEGCMNTGSQRTSQTPLHAATSTTPAGFGKKGKPTPSKYLPLIMAMHPVAYVATATLSHIEDYSKKLRKAKEASKRGFAYIHIFAPCVIGFKIASDETIQVCRAAVKTNYFPLWEMEDGKFRFTANGDNPKPIQDYLSLCGKFSHFGPEDIAEFQKIVNDRYKMVKSLVDATSDPS